MFLTITNGYESFQPDFFSEKNKLGTKCIDILNNYQPILEYIDLLIEKFSNVSHKEDIVYICSKFTNTKYLLQLNDICGMDFFHYLFYFSVSQEYMELEKLRKETIDTINLLRSHKSDTNELEKLLLERNDKYYIDYFIRYSNSIKEDIILFYSQIENNNLLDYKYLDVYTIPKKTIRYLYKNPQLTPVSLENLTDKKNIIPCERYELFGITDILQIYKSLIIEDKLIIKKCKNCHKFFVPTSRTDEKYCNNISPQSKTKTCKEYGAKATYRSSIQNSILKKEHERTSQYYRMRIMREKNNKIKNKYLKSFELYKENYNQKKEQYKDKKISEEEFKEWIISQKIINKEGNKNECKRKS